MVVIKQDELYRFGPIPPKVSFSLRFACIF